MNLFTKLKHREQTYGCREKGMVVEFGMDVSTVLYLKRITNKDFGVV